MPKSANQKLKLLYIVKILQEKTNDNVGITASELIKELEKYDIKAERKSIYTDMEALQNFGYDIVNSKSKENGGYRMASRSFELPELKLLVDLEQPVKYHDHDAFFHTVEAVKYSEKDLILRLAMLLHDIGKPETYNKDENGKITFYGHAVKGERIAFKILNRLGYDKNLISEVCMYIRHHMDYAPTEKSFNKMLKELGNDISKVDKLLKVKMYDAYASKGTNGELADKAREIDLEYRKILSKYQR